MDRVEHGNWELSISIWKRQNSEMKINGVLWLFLFHWIEDWHHARIWSGNTHCGHGRRGWITITSTPARDAFKVSSCPWEQILRRTDNQSKSFRWFMSFLFWFCSSILFEMVQQLHLLEYLESIPYIATGFSSMKSYGFYMMWNANEVWVNVNDLFTPIIFNHKRH